MAFLSPFPRPSLALFFFLICAISGTIRYPRGRAVASPLPSRPGFFSSVPDPVQSDYPDDAAIAAAFMGVGSDGAVFSVSYQNRMQLENAFALEFPNPRKRGLLDVFPTNFMFNLGRSERWLSDFVKRCSLHFTTECAGTVYLLAKWPSGPTGCGLFTDDVFPALKRNLAVTQIILVNEHNFQEQRVFWARETTEEEYQREGLETVIATGVTAGIAAGASLLGPSLVGPLATMFAPSDDNDKKTENFKQVLPESFTNLLTPSLTTGDDTNPAQYFSPNAPVDGGDDVFSTIPTPGLDLNVFSPDQLELPATNQPNLFSTTSDANVFITDVVAQPGAETNLFSTIPRVGTEILAADATTSSEDLFAKRHLTLQPRACGGSSALDPDLAPWYERSLGVVGQNLNSPGPYPGAPPWVGTIRVTQRRREALVPFSYQLSVHITHQSGLDMGSIEAADVTPFQELQVPRTVLASSLYVWTQLGDDAPIKFRYGTNGIVWDSSDSVEHNCKTDPWKGDDREIDCEFNY